MATKNPQVQQKQTYTVNVRIGGEVSVEVQAGSLEEAITLSRAYSFNDVVSQDFDDLSIETEVTGVFKN